VIFKLPARYGIEVADTPALDLAKRGCHLCEDWPCVTACEPHALARSAPKLNTPEQNAPELKGTELKGTELKAPELKERAPRLAELRIDTDVCLPYSGPECGACADSCPIPGALEWRDRVRPHINQDLCAGCALCREACILTPKAITVQVAIGEPS
jgi:ferredoxin-type protein NapG